MTRCRAVSSVISVVLLVAVVVILATTVTAIVFEFGDDISDTGPNTAFEIDYANLNDGVPKNDTITISHRAGDVLRRDQLEVVIGDDLVYNETGDSETSNGNYVVPGLIVEVDQRDEFNDLNKPCFVDGKGVSPTGTCGGPPGDSDGSDAGVVLEWAANVSAGERIVIQERNDPQSVDVIEPGETVTIIYRGDNFTTLIAEETVPGS